MARAVVVWGGGGWPQSTAPPLTVVEGRGWATGGSTPPTGAVTAQKHRHTACGAAQPQSTPHHSLRPQHCSGRPVTRPRSSAVWRLITLGLTSFHPLTSSQHVTTVPLPSVPNRHSCPLHYMGGSVGVLSAKPLGMRLGWIHLHPAPPTQSSWSIARTSLDCLHSHFASLYLFRDRLHRPEAADSHSSPLVSAHVLLHTP